MKSIWSWWRLLLSMLHQRRAVHDLILSCDAKSPLLFHLSLSRFPPSFPPSPFLLPPSFLSFFLCFPFLFCTLRWNTFRVSWTMTAQVCPSHNSWNMFCCCCSVTKPCLTLHPCWTAVCQASLSFTVSQSLLKLKPIELVKPTLPLLLPSPVAFNLSHHWSLFQWVSSSHQVAKLLELQFQHQSFQWIFRVDFL